MRRAGRPEGLDTSSLLMVVTGGVAISVRLLEEIRDQLPGTWIAQAYGSTEMAGLITAFNANIARDGILLHYKSQSCGRPLCDIQYKIVDPETECILGPNEQGELRLKARSCTIGYYNQDSSSAFDSDGWLKTGDIVYYDEDQCFYIVDRIKEMLKYKGWQIAPAAIEQVVMQHPAVKQTVVIGIPVEEDGDHLMAVVVLYDDDTNTTAEEIEDFVNERVSDKQQLRAGLKLTDTLPMTPTGKVRRNHLKEMAIKGLL